MLKLNVIPIHNDKSAGSTFVNGREVHVCYVCGRISADRRTRGGKVMCSKHYKQEWRHGTILDSNPRTTSDMNEIRIDGDTAEMDLYDKHGNVIATALIDSDVVPVVSTIKWCLGTKNYVITNKDAAGKRNNLHHVVLNQPGETEIDHINNDPLDNRRENLRVVTHAKNMHNQKVTPRGYHKTTSGKWLASIRERGNQIHLGQYETQDEAAFARQCAEQMLRGAMAYDREPVIIDQKRAIAIREYVTRQLARYIDIFKTGEIPEMAWDNPDRPRPIRNRDVQTPPKDDTKAS